MINTILASNSDSHSNDVDHNCLITEIYDVI